MEAANKIDVSAKEADRIAVTRSPLFKRAIKALRKSLSLIQNAINDASLVIDDDKEYFKHVLKLITSNQAVLDAVKELEDDNEND